MKIKKIVIEICCLILFIVMLILIILCSQFSNSDIIASKLVPFDKKAAIQNTKYLQELVDFASKRGGATIKLPQGEFYFSVDENDGSHHDLENDESGPNNGSNYVIECRNKVSFVGAGIDSTILKPLGNYIHGIDMFWYVNNKNYSYLEDVDFKKFTIDGSNAKATAEKSNARGKGFNIYPVKNCNWESIKVMNTDGTGFGINLPIECTIKNCYAVGCGKAATIDDVGAAGFGIGIGYSENESIYIKNCTAIANRRFGFSLEHQGRFNNSIKARKANGKNKDIKYKGYVVDNCIARGNLYNFGGEKANDVTYYQCQSQVPLDEDPNPFESGNKYAMYFGLNSRRINIIECVFEQKYYDKFNDAVEWAIRNNIIDVGDFSYQLEPSVIINRSYALSLLWKLSNRDGDVLLLDDRINTGFSDVETNHWRYLSAKTLNYIDSLLWGIDNDIVDKDDDEFRPDDKCTYFDFIKWLWKFDGSNEAIITSNNYDQYENYKDALNWAYSSFLIDDEIKVDDELNKIEALKILYRYRKINYYFDELEKQKPLF